MLVFAADLQQVEEVGGRCMDSDKVLVGLGLWGGQVNYFEIVRSLYYYN